MWIAREMFSFFFSFFVVRKFCLPSPLCLVSYCFQEALRESLDAPVNSRCGALVNLGVFLAAAFPHGGGPLPLIAHQASFYVHTRHAWLGALAIVFGSPFSPRARCFLSRQKQSTAKKTSAAPWPRWIPFNGRHFYLA